MSSSSSNITTTTVNGRTVISGLSSGIDVDSIVESLITADSTKLNKLKQQEQLTKWKQEAYQNIISDIQDFYDKYFNTTSSSSILNQKTFQQLSVTSSNIAVSATYTSKAIAGTHTVTVSQLATAATMKTSGRLSKDITGDSAVEFSSLAGTSFVISLDGTKTTVALDSTITDLDSLQSAIDDTVGKCKISITEDSSGILSIIAADNSGVQEITLSNPDDETSALGALGFGDDATLSNRINTSDTLETLSSLKNGFTFNSDGEVEISINGQNFIFDKSTKLSEMMQEINNSDAGVTMNYDELNDRLVVTADSTGAQKTLSMNETSSTFLTTVLSSYTAGTDAKLTIDGQNITRSSNTFTVNGVTYTVNHTTDNGEDAAVTLTQDMDAIYNNISGFIDAYNDLIDTINEALSEDYDSDYPTLTDAQESSMTDDEIEKWNKKAKTGLLEGDSILQGFLDDMRTALYDSVSGVSVNLAEIGITTGSYDEKGKLYVDEDKLMKALETNSQEVEDLFTQQSVNYSGTVTVRTMNINERQMRYKEEGIAYRFYDVIADNISSLRDSNGNKGALVEMAGMDADSSTDNMLSDEINKYKDRIDKEEERLDDERERLYRKYTSMETYIEEMNSQLSFLLSYFNSSLGC